MRPFLLSSFIFVRCFKTAYTDHCNTKHPPIGSRNIDSRRLTPTKSILGETENEIPDQDRYSGLDDDQWVANGTDKEYIPGAEDIGCILKVSQVRMRRCRILMVYFFLNPDGMQINP